MCFAWISEQTAIISLYSLNLSDFITEAECLLRGGKWVFKSARYSFVLKGWNTITAHSSKANTRNESRPFAFMRQSHGIVQMKMEVQ